MVAERFVYCGIKIEKFFWNIEIENVDMSNDKGDEKSSRCKPQVFYVKLIFVELFGP